MFHANQAHPQENVDIHIHQGVRSVKNNEQIRSQSPHVTCSRALGNILRDNSLWHNDGGCHSIKYFLCGGVPEAHFTSQSRCKVRVQIGFQKKRSRTPLICNLNGPLEAAHVRGRRAPSIATKPNNSAKIANATSDHAFTALRLVLQSLNTGEIYGLKTGS
ncbi:hypothetical protein EVAR_70430_1 [Eumeta japonica]|uniref:Uncharacterized protein n=1 Tax=Eumeta variegata TaxID=151549 RepID=A0A4C2AB36_EUMVA|nr:hypothetical protein EVAR_70430_1 [Eumeta japonica]